MGRKESLEKIYHAHHLQKGRYGYLFCDGKRGPYLQKWIGEGKKVLDVGCRDGMLTNYYAANNDVLGVDIDSCALALAKERCHIETLWLDVNQEWPFAKEAFDVIVACEVVEHLYFPGEFLENVVQSLLPGGIFIGSVPNAFRIRNRWKFLWGREYETDPTHVRQFSFSSLQRWLSSKFSCIEIHPLGGKIAPFVPVHPIWPPKIQALFSKDLLWKCVKNS